MSRTFGVATIQMACASDTVIAIGSQTYSAGTLAPSHRQPVLKGHAAFADPTPLIASKRIGVRMRRARGHSGIAAQTCLRHWKTRMAHLPPAPTTLRNGARP